MLKISQWRQAQPDCNSSDCTAKLCTTFCCNRDHDQGGEWCFVADPWCEDSDWGWTNWGYCKKPASEGVDEQAWHHHHHHPQLAPKPFGARQRMAQVIDDRELSRGEQI